MIYPNSYFLYKDIDWFCNINGILIHVASAGGAIPKSIYNRDILQRLQENVFQAPMLFSKEEININRNYLFEQLNLDDVAFDNYVSSFVDMSRKGFVSFDRTFINDPEDNRYHIVCMPPIFDIRPDILGIPSFHKDNFEINGFMNGVYLYDLLS